MINWEEEATKSEKPGGDSVFEILVATRKIAEELHRLNNLLDTAVSMWETGNLHHLERLG